MNQFNWTKAIGFGALIWAIMFALASGVVSVGFSLGIGWGIALAIVSGVITYVLAANSKAMNMSQAFGYGAVWVVVGVVLDLVISRQFAPTMFTTWTYYLGYALVLFAPAVQFGLKSSSTETRAF